MNEWREKWPYVLPLHRSAVNSSRMCASPLPCTNICSSPAPCPVSIFPASNAVGGGAKENQPRKSQRCMESHLEAWTDKQKAQWRRSTNVMLDIFGHEMTSIKRLNKKWGQSVSVDIYLLCGNLIFNACSKMDLVKSWPRRGVEPLVGLARRRRD